MIALSLGSILAAAPGTVALIATVAPGTPTLLPGLVAILSSLV